MSRLQEYTSFSILKPTAEKLKAFMAKKPREITLSVQIENWLEKEDNK